MSTDALWRDAEFWAKQRAMWRTLADARRAPCAPGSRTRRQCLYQARQAEARIVNLAIRAERDAPGDPPETPPVPKIGVPDGRS